MFIYIYRYVCIFKYIYFNYSFNYSFKKQTNTNTYTNYKSDHIQAEYTTITQNIPQRHCSFINRFADQTQAPSCTGNMRVERASLFQTLDQINFIS